MRTKTRHRLTDAELWVPGSKSAMSYPSGKPAYLTRFVTMSEQTEHRHTGKERAVGERV